MSEDARNSIYLWVVGVSFFDLFWVALHFKLLDWVPDR